MFIISSFFPLNLTCPCPYSQQSYFNSNLHVDNKSIHRIDTCTLPCQGPTKVKNNLKTKMFFVWCTSVLIYMKENGKVVPRAYEGPNLLLLSIRKTSTWWRLLSGACLVWQFFFLQLLFIFFIFFLALYMRSPVICFD